MFSRGNKKFNSKYRRGKKTEIAGDRNLQFLATDKLSETEVGITEYLSHDLPGFTGIIKARFSDFHVNEINNSHEIAKITDVNVPQVFYDCSDNKDEYDERLKKLITEDVLQRLHDIVVSDEDLNVEIDAENLSKEDRCAIHDGIKTVFGSKIVANTTTVDGKKIMLFNKPKKNSENVDVRQKWPLGIGEYVYFLVYKESLDTLDACFKLADCFKRNANMFTYAGVKDHRAKTTQWFCSYKLDPKQALLKTKPLKRLHIGNFTFHAEPLKLGQLKGNHFKVALRNVTAEDGLINNSVSALKENGFINYYGLQRFGNNKEVPTYEIGIKLLQGKFKDACDLILKVKTNEDPMSEITQAKRVFSETNDCQLASKLFKKLNNKCIESKLLLGFVKNNPNDYVNSLENIPRNMRLLYIHAFQSLVWNTMTSLRIKKFGLEPIEGDIVLISKDLDEVKDSENIKILTKDNLKEYSIYDVVLPLPGYDVKYPENELKESYREILSSYGLALEMPKQSVKTYTLSGAYRKILCKVTDVSWKKIRYDHPDDTLIRSDYEELMGEKEPEDMPQGQFKAIVVEFTLPACGYATMVLREILKMDTSTNAHAKLNKYYAPDDILKKDTNTSEDTAVKEDSLLSNAEKYDIFKRQVFGMEVEPEEQSKRKLEETDEIVNKKSKTCADES